MASDRWEKTGTTLADMRAQMLSIFDSPYAVHGWRDAWGWENGRFRLLGDTYLTLPIGKAWRVTTLFVPSEKKGGWAARTYIHRCSRGAVRTRQEQLRSPRRPVRGRDPRTRGASRARSAIRIHAGECEESGGKLVGIAVHIGARIVSAALILARVRRTRRTRLTGGGDTSDLNPVWSPDRSKIYYEHGSCGDHDGLRVMSPDGTGDRMVTTDDWGGGGLLNWEGKGGRWLDTATISPDGSRIAYRLGELGAWKNSEPGRTGRLSAS